MNMNPNLYKKHCNCEIAVDRNYRPKKHGRVNAQANPLMYELLHTITTTPPALMCVTHGRWLKWLTSEDAQAIESVLAETPTPPRRVVRIDDLPLTTLK